MTALLVSVRNSKESLLACRCGVDIVDLKEPTSGSLGCVDRTVAEQVATTVAGPTRFSLAMGELGDWHPEKFAMWPLAAFHFAKIGLAGMQDRANWCDDWRTWKNSLPGSISAVAVAYVDAGQARSPSVERVVGAAVQSGFQYLLLDTFRKDIGQLTDYHPVAEISRLAADLLESSVTLAVAGRLNLAALVDLLAIDIPIVAVRGAACENGRTSSLSAERLRQLCAVVSQANARKER
jgi:uncharacterized protein (UPF0264 family)